MNIIEKLDTNEKKRLREKKLTRGETLFYEDERCDCIGIILSGSVQIVSFLPDGKQILYNSLNKGEIFGNNLIFSSEPFYKGNIVAKENSVIALLRRDDLLLILETNKEFLLEYLKIQSNFSKELNSRIRLLSLESAEERFLYYMHIHKNRVAYHSISDLARQLYLERETLSRLLSRFLKEKRIIRHDKTIRLI
ncbi:MAG: Crp/Fnr family transcriptional regulator [Erysipelotrichaceae bacterium]|nr:Crp/Fnr family transcriptional regulator [Erysipelotrichaceae bacterium]